MRRCVQGVQTHSLPLPRPRACPSSAQLTVHSLLTIRRFSACALALLNHVDQGQKPLLLLSGSG